MSALKASEPAQAVEANSDAGAWSQGRTEAAPDQESAELVAVQTQSAGLVVDFGAAHVEGRIAVGELL